MSTITAILEPDSDGCVHLPVPEEMRHGKVRVVASLQEAEGSVPDAAAEAEDTAIAQRVQALNPVSPEAAARVAALFRLQASMTARGVDFEEWKRSIHDARR